MGGKHSPEQQREYSRKHYLKNREKKLARTKERRAEIRERDRERYRSDPERRARIARSNKKWREANPHAARAIVKRQRDKKRDWLMEQKRGKKCVVCGEADPVCLDWHHKDPKTKKFTVSHMWSHSIRHEIVLAEIAKCIIICSNCHRKLHRSEIWQRP